MITTYDLESCSAIDLDDSTSGEPMRPPELAFAVELRLHEVVPMSTHQDARPRDFSGVIAGQLLAQL